MRFHNCALLGIVTALAGCGIFGPNYSKPSITTPNDWQSKDYLATTTDGANLPAMAWWRNFNDVQLNSLIESALINNNDIQVAVGNIITAQGLLQQIDYAWIPTMGGAVGFTNQSNGQQIPGYFAGLTPNYTLNIVQQIRSQQFAKANLAAVKAAQDNVRLGIISQVASSYLTLLGQDYQLQLQQRLVTDLGELLKLTGDQYKYGLISLYTLQQYQQQYEQAKAVIPIIRNNIVKSQNALRLLINQNPGDITRGLSFMQVKDTGIIPVNLPSTVLKNRPDVQQAEEELIAANANIGVATSTFFPSISLTNDVGAASNALSGLFNSGTGFWNTQIAATMPILSFGTYGQIKQAKGQYYAAYYKYVETVRVAFQSVDNDLSAHAQYTTSLWTQMQFSKSAKVAYTLSQASYSKGLYSYPTLLQNKINYDNAEISVAQSKILQLNTIVQLYQDLGGGYMIDNDESNVEYKIESKE